MFSTNSEVFIQPVGINKHNILNGKEPIGEIRKRSDAPVHIQNTIYALISLHTCKAVDVEIVDHEKGVVGYIRKSSGLRAKKFHLFKGDQTYVGSVESGLSVKNIKTLDKNEQPLYKLEVSSSGIDYNILEFESNQGVASIRKRSIVYESIKDNLYNADGYYITIPEDPVKALHFIGICFTIGFYQSS
ncbi:hypothetical protein [Aquisalibacillus elongatus]|uniref:Uncharacterized protein n=1 Tax=Aquisalibacillus elongatus TaxID=485577 RepID=A0A3N5BDB4_9BACI|nr:hypothetical protein [Aquisalibacillus elongatus]RPF53330.1 hypothetical protein EDC24_1828 [Aquisalibacillus elongatus]